MNGLPVFVGTEEPTLLAEALVRITDAIRILEDPELWDSKVPMALDVLKRGQA